MACAVVRTGGSVSSRLVTQIAILLARVRNAAIAQSFLGIPVALLYFIALFTWFCLPTLVTKAGVLGIRILRFDVIKPLFAIIRIAEIRFPMMAENIIVEDGTKHVYSKVAPPNLLILIGA